MRENASFYQRNKKCFLAGAASLGLAGIVHTCYTDNHDFVSINPLRVEQKPNSSPNKNQTTSKDANRYLKLIRTLRLFEQSMKEYSRQHEKNNANCTKNYESKFSSSETCKDNDGSAIIRERWYHRRTNYSIVTKEFDSKGVKTKITSEQYFDNGNLRSLLTGYYDDDEITVISDDDANGKPDSIAIETKEETITFTHLDPNNDGETDMIVQYKKDKQTDKNTTYCDYNADGIIDEENCNWDILAYLETF